MPQIPPKMADMKKGAEAPFFIRPLQLILQRARS